MISRRDSLCGESSISRISICIRRIEMNRVFGGREKERERERETEIIIETSIDVVVSHAWV